MEIILIVFWVLGVLIFIRGAQLAQGKSTKKFYKGEKFLSYQKALFIIFAICAILSILSLSFYFLYASIINLILSGMFYLQPTPRTTRKIFYVFAFINAVLLAITTL